MLLQITKMILSVYRSFFSPLIHLLFGPAYGCRFEPSCSRYSSEAFETHGPVHGLCLTLSRLLRCHPFSQGGYDPVPHHDIAGPCFNSDLKQGR